MQQLRQRILIPVTLLWLFVVIAFYYWGHQYSLIPIVASGIRIGYQVGVLVLVWAAAYGFGGWSTRLLRIEFQSPAECVTFSLGLGAVFLGLIGLLLSFLGLVISWIMWPITLVGGVLGILWLRKRSLKPPFPPKPSDEPYRRFDYFLFSVITILLLLGLILALAPPYAWDGLSTHLVLVKQIVKIGSIEPSILTARPVAGHLFFIWGMMLGGETLPQLLSYTQGLIIVGAVVVFTRQHFGRRLAVLAAAILCSVEVFILTAGWPYLDVPTGMMGVLSVFALIGWLLDRGSEEAGRNLKNPRAWLVIATIFGVTAAHTKLNGLFIYPVIVAAILLALFWNRREWRKIAIDVSLALVTAIILTLVWVLAERALQPEAASGIAQIASSTAEVAGELSDSSATLYNIWSYVKISWEMTIIGQQGALLYDGTISPLFLIFIPLVLLLRKKPRVIWALMLVAGIEFFAWLFVPKGYHQNRHLILAYPIFSILVAYFLSRVPELDLAKFSLSGFIRILLVLVFTIQVLFLLRWTVATRPFGYLLNLESRDEFLDRLLNGGTSPGYYDLMQYMNEALSPDSIVAVPWPEPRIYYCEMTCVLSPFSRGASLEAMLDVSRELRFDYLILSEKGLDYWIDFSRENPAQFSSVTAYAAELREFVNQYGTLVHNEQDSFYLYRLSLD